MKRIVRLTESDLTRIVRRVISEQEQTKATLVNSIDQDVAGTNYRAMNRYQLGGKYYVQIKHLTTGSKLIYTCDGSKNYGAFKNKEDGSQYFLKVNTFTESTTDLEKYYCKGTKKELTSKYGIEKEKEILRLTINGKNYPVVYEGTSQTTGVNYFYLTDEKRTKKFQRYGFYCTPEFKIVNNATGEDITSDISYANTIKKYCPAG